MTNPKLLDTLGIRISLRSLPSWPEYVVAFDRWHCGWLRHILRRWLVPARHREAKQQYEEMVKRIQQEFLNAALEEGKELIE